MPHSTVSNNQKYKHALVLPGGAAHGAWQIAACKRYLLDNPSFKPDLITGVSVGALNGALVAQEEDPMQGIDHGIQLWKGINSWRDVYRPTIKTPFVLLSFLANLFKRTPVRKLFSEGLMRTAPLKRLCEANLKQQRIKELGNKFIVGTVNTSTGRYEIHDENSENLIDAILASAAFPIFFEPTIINGEPHVDGGARNKTPFREAIKYKPEKLTVVMTGAVSAIGYESPENLVGFLSMMLRILNIMSDEAWRDDMRNFDPNGSNTQIEIVCRRDHLQTSAMMFRKKEIHSMIDEVLEPKTQAMDMYQVLSLSQLQDLITNVEEQEEVK